MTIENKTIVLIVSGGIAAYKACTLTSALVKKGANVEVIMTEGAKAFVSPVTFQALSRNPVHDDLYTEKVPHQITHIDLADRADRVVVAPATANIIAKMAMGLADDLATTVMLATKAPLWVAPAMNVNMYHHPQVQENIEKLKALNYHILDPAAGNLACGWVGKGRMVEPEEIAEALEASFNESSKEKSLDLKGKHWIVTAGPTQEKLDPVRYFTNRSSGKMGYAIAEAAARFGAEVTLVSGPTTLETPTGVERIDIESAEDMYREVMQRYEAADVVVKAAAVADYRPEQSTEHKIKKSQEALTVTFVRNPDILKTLGQQKKKQILVGFAAETDNLERYAMEKLDKKHLDMIVANNVGATDSGFAVDTNRVTLFYKNGKKRALELMSKQNVAIELCYEIGKLLKSRDAE
ncbi:phosphopantothenoylcysteine decarboxylase/phosphopantothenate--cysteine ligase [Pullulanibacillus pueri]|uniref:Coenzyme A biosynthesis bifunctional protein CoaBC n=1 Tax=Pullulanibacillus pueri TaxID=1437324 RepID=A0A8J3EK95_9BACL|nr:bifunctional phosphopantothenoylcysteine decarboxylase/phosphopantothenate--cysteine ligase CoaBC [Pullulanibacillus pueri]MBM7680179.1 phosphopantothenoylcysteine decarboxylase/phosphopantothenate--cysteine ligase [Pullulanibacillus pueri]GGH74753.1 putative coenzyme A biosynthesis bifunctional protein CoaBC [Pullulanibacillus pueri]